MLACGGDGVTRPADDTILPRPDIEDTREPDIVTATLVVSAAEALPGKRVAVRLDDPTTVSGTVTLDGVDVRFHRGRALLTTTPEAAPAAWGITTRAFDEATDLRIDGELTVAAGETRTIAAGTRVLLGPNASIVVAGTLTVAGTAAQPVLFTADDSAWAAIEVRGGHLELDETWLVGGGADRDRFAGHSSSDPVIAATDGEVHIHGGGIVDAVGKALYTERSVVELDGVTIARCDTGGEHVDSHVTMRDSWVFEIPDADGVFGDDDNDGIYLRLGSHTIEHTVFAMGEDDGIDQNGADVTIHDVWIEGMHHEGIATSNGGRVSISGVVVRDANQGIEVGYGAPVVDVSDSLVTACGVGLRWGDEYDWEALGTLSVTRTVALQNTVDVETEDPQQGQAPVGAVQITCSAVGDAEAQSDGGNIRDVAPWVGLCPPPLSACEQPIGAEQCR